MSTGLAPLIVVDAPLPRAPLRGLLFSPAAATQPTQGPNADRWTAGAVIYPYPDAMPDATDPCTSDSLRLKLTPDGVEIPDEFDAYTAYLGNVCTAGGIGDWAEFKSRADVALKARSSWALERQLAWGTFVDSNPFLADGAMQYPAGIVAIPAANAVAWLDGWLGLFGQAGVIHMGPEVASFLGPNVLYVDSQGQTRTMAGTPVIVGQGYSNVNGADDLNPAGSGAEAGAGQSWIFASSPILYRQSDNVYSLPENLSETLDRDDNTVVYRAERDQWVAFDGGPHAGVLADWTPTITGSP